MFLITGTYLSVVKLTDWCVAWFWPKQSGTLASTVWKLALVRTGLSIPSRQFGCGHPISRLGEFSATGMGCSVSAGLHARNFFWTCHTAIDITLRISRQSNEDSVRDTKTTPKLPSSPETRRLCPTAKAGMCSECRIVTYWKGVSNLSMRHQR